MRILGQVCLLLAFVSSGYAAFAYIAGSLSDRPKLLRAGRTAAVICLLCLSTVMLILARALVLKDFQFKYVEQYVSRLLPWQYSLSALWVGQAGSLLLWAWLLCVLAFCFAGVNARKLQNPGRPAFGFLMTYLCFLIGTMVFAADPMERNIAPADEGNGLSPLLQHPSMLIHPPVVFLGYAAWAVPCALALGALVRFRWRTDNAIGESTNSSRMDADWVKMARPWALFAWAVLGIGILLGAEWSYEELGWGGYWAWDPVENGSLIPWLTGTALLHGLMAWRYRSILKKSTLVLAIITFGLCNFATFLTRSGIFSSLHAFSQSLIGWLFLGLMLVLWTGGTFLVIRARRALKPEHAISSIWSRESQILISAGALLALAIVTLVGTLCIPLSEVVIGKRIVVGTAFYNQVSIPVGLVLLATVALAPLLRWGEAPTPAQGRILRFAVMAAAAASLIAWSLGIHHPLAIVVFGLVALTLFAFAGCLWLDSRRFSSEPLWSAIPKTFVAKRRQYAGFLIHLGFASLLVGITGSALGSRQTEVVIEPGQTIEWSGRSIRFVELRQLDQGDTFMTAADLEIGRQAGSVIHLWPAQHLHRLQNEWTTEVAIHSDWGGDFYTILHNGEPGGAIRLTLIVNPLMRWMWLGGWIIAAGTLCALWPDRLRRFTGNTTRAEDVVTFRSDEHDRTLPVRHREKELVR